MSEEAGMVRAALEKAISDCGGCWGEHEGTCSRCAYLRDALARLNSAPAASQVGEVRKLQERLRKERQVYNGRNTFRSERVNPDGPEAADTLTRLSAENESMREALQVSANKFREYQILHHAKKTREGDQKAARNAEMAEMCEQALSPKTGRGDG